MKTTLSFVALCLLGTQALNLKSTWSAGGVSKTKWGAAHGRHGTVIGGTKKTVGGAHGRHGSVIGGTKKTVGGYYGSHGAKIGGTKKTVGGVYKPRTWA